MVATDVPQRALLCIILVKMENKEIVKSGKRSDVLIYPTTGAWQATLITKVPLAKNCGKIPDGLEFDDMEALEDHEGERFIIRGKG